MFTGIVEELGQVIRIERSSSHSNDAIRLVVQTRLTDTAPGESISVNGVCLTVEKVSQTELQFFIGFETLNRTQLGRLKLGSAVNLERALTLQKRLSGHFLLGHIDGLAQLESKKELDQAYELEFSIPKELIRYCAEKGSIGLNGVSLTLFGLTLTRFRVMIIPHTWIHTNLSQLKGGDQVNVEVDILAKYVERLSCHS